MRLIHACQYKISKLIRPGFINYALDGKDLNLVKYENEKAQFILLSELLGEKKNIVLYFSAHWCPPCKKFTPVLADC